MKKITLSLLLTCFLAVTPFVSSARESHPSINGRAVAPADTAGLYKLETRIIEINTMDKSDLSFSEKRALRKEVREINGKMKAMGQYVYISLGTILIILLILILIF